MGVSGGGSAPGLGSGQSFSEGQQFGGGQAISGVSYTTNTNFYGNPLGYNPWAPRLGYGPPPSGLGRGNGAHYWPQQAPAPSANDAAAAAGQYAPPPGYGYGPPPPGLGYGGVWQVMIRGRGCRAEQSPFLEETYPYLEVTFSVDEISLA